MIGHWTDYVEVTADGAITWGPAPAVPVEVPSPIELAWEAEADRRAERGAA